MLLLIAMTFIWVFLTGELTLGNVGFGFILSFLLLFIGGPRMDVNYFRRKPGFRIFSYSWKLISFVGFFFKELLFAGVTVFASIIKPSILKPGVVAVPLSIKTDAEITLLANLITLTPGTLTLDVSTDHKVMYVHSIQVDDPDEFRKDIKDGFEKRVREIMNPA
ncbi:MAG: Na+/H+ antiporter subunit E [Chloroflexota bacterium]